MTGGSKRQRTTTTTRRARQLQKLRTFNNGVEVRKSSIASGGRGLFVTGGSNVKRLDFITQYSGPIISHAEAKQRLLAGTHTHIKSRFPMRDAIDGLQEPQVGQGAGSFANDGTREHKNNARFIALDDRLTAERIIVLQATRDIVQDEEVFVGYGKGYWLKH